LYDSVALDQAAELIKDWTVEEMAALRRDVPRVALQAPFRGGTLQAVAKQVIAIARDGLKRRNRRDRMGERDESHFLDTLAAIADSGRCPAEEKLDKFHGPWKGSVDPLYTEYAY
jgi:glutamate--cysteine ligase